VIYGMDVPAMDADVESKSCWANTEIGEVKAGFYWV